MGTAVVLLVLLLVVLFAVRGTVRKMLYGGGCCGEKDRVKRLKVDDQDSAHYPYHYVLSIEGMTCSNCKRHVENALNRMDGVWAKVDLGKRSADVRTKQPQHEQAFRKAVWEAGYQMTGCEQQKA